MSGSEKIANSEKNTSFFFLLFKEPYKSWGIIQELTATVKSKIVMDHARGDKPSKHSATWWLVGEGHLTRFSYRGDRRNIASIIFKKGLQKL